MPHNLRPPTAADAIALAAVDRLAFAFLAYLGPKEGDKFLRRLAISLATTESNVVAITEWTPEAAIQAQADAWLRDRVAAWMARKV